MKHIRCQNGTTLIEIILAAVLGMFLMAGILTIHVMTNRNFEVTSALTHLLGSTHNAVEQMERDIRQAFLVEPSRVFLSGIVATGDDKIVLKLPGVDASGNIIPGVWDYVAYYLDPGDATLLRRVVEPEGTGSVRPTGQRVLAQNVESLLFRSGGVNLSAVSDVTTRNAIQVSFVGKNTVLQTPLTFAVNTEVRLRNK